VSLSTPSGAASPSQPIFDLSTITSAIDFAATDDPEQFTPSKKHSKRRRRANRNTSDSFIQRYTDFTFLGSLAYTSNATTVIATPLSGPSGSTSTTTATDEALAAKLEAVVSLSTLSGAASPSQPIFDLSTITSATNVTATDNSEQSAPSKKHSKRRRRAIRNTSDSFIQRCTDLAFRFCALSSCIE